MYIPKNCVAGTYGSSIFSILMNLCSDFHSRYTSLYSIIVTEGSSFPTSLPAFAIIYFLHDNYFNWGGMDSQRNLHFPDG